MSEKKKQATIVRASKDSHFVTVVNAVVQNRSMSYEARGLLVYLLSLPTDWVVRPTQLEQEGCKRDKMSRMIGELVAAGHIIREDVKDNGRFAGVQYTVYELPQTENPYTVKPPTGIPSPVNPQLKTTYVGDDDLTKNDGNKDTHNTKGDVCVEIFGTQVEKMVRLYGVERVSLVCSHAISKDDPPAWASAALKKNYDLRAVGVVAPKVVSSVFDTDEMNLYTYWRACLKGVGLNVEQVDAYIERYPEDRYLLDDGNPYADVERSLLLWKLDIVEEPVVDDFDSVLDDEFEEIDNG